MRSVLVLGCLDRGRFAPACPPSPPNLQQGALEGLQPRRQRHRLVTPAAGKGGAQADAFGDAVLPWQVVWVGGGGRKGLVSPTTKTV